MQATEWLLFAYRQRCCNMIFSFHTFYRELKVTPIFCFLFGKHESLWSEICSEFPFLLTVEKYKIFPDFPDMFIPASSQRWKFSLAFWCWFYERYGNSYQCGNGGYFWKTSTRSLMAPEIDWKKIYHKYYPIFLDSTSVLWKLIGESHSGFLTQCVIMTLGVGGGLSPMIFWNSEKLSNFKVCKLLFTSKFIFVSCYSPSVQVKYQKQY